MLSYTKIAETLKDTAASQTKAGGYTVLETLSHTGPGLLNGWEWADYEDNVFLARSAIPVVFGKKKVIISSPLLCDRPLNHIELTYFASLIEHYDVYFWQGPKIAFMSNRSPLLYSLSDFVSRKKDIVSARKEDVVTALVKQGDVDLNSVIVLDKNGLDSAINLLLKHYPDYYKYKQFGGFRGVGSSYFDSPKANDPTHLDLGWYSDIENLTKIVCGIKQNEIKSITVQTITPEDAAQIIRRFPCLETFFVMFPTTQWITDCLPVFSNTNITISLDWSWVNKTITLPDNLNINTLIIRDSYSHRYTIHKLVFNSSDAKVKHLKIIRITNVDLTILPRLEHLEIQSCDRLNLIIPKVNQLEKLSIHDSTLRDPLDSLDLELFPSLQSLSYLGNSPRLPRFLTKEEQNGCFGNSCFDLYTRNHRLTEVEIERAPVDLSLYTALKNFKCDSRHQAAILPEECKVEEVITRTPPTEFYPCTSLVSNLDRNYSNPSFLEKAKYATLATLGEPDSEMIHITPSAWHARGYNNNSTIKFKSSEITRKLKYFKLELSDFSQDIIIDFTDCQELQSIYIKCDGGNRDIRLIFNNCPQLTTLVVLNAGGFIVEGLDHVQCPKLRYPYVQASRFTPRQDHIQRHSPDRYSEGDAFIALLAEVTWTSVGIVSMCLVMNAGYLNFLIMWLAFLHLPLQ